MNQAKPQPPNTDFLADISFMILSLSSAYFHLVSLLFWFWCWATHCMHLFPSHVTQPPRHNKLKAFNLIAFILLKWFIGLVTGFVYLFQPNNVVRTLTVLILEFDANTGFVCVCLHGYMFFRSFLQPVISFRRTWIA